MLHKGSLHAAKRSQVTRACIDLRALPPTRTPADGSIRIKLQSTYTQVDSTKGIIMPTYTYYEEITVVVREKLGQRRYRLWVG